MTVYRLTRLDTMRAEGFTGEQMLDALTVAINDLGIVMGLQVIHGSRAMQVYADHGGLCRFDEDGHVLVPVKVPMTDEQEATEFTGCRYCGAPAGTWCIAVHRYAHDGQRRRALRPHAGRMNDWRRTQPREGAAHGTETDHDSAADQ